MSNVTDEQLEAYNDWRESQPSCEKCGTVAAVYAMGKGSGDWGGRYCEDHIPTGFIITDRYDTKGNSE
jgi:hypothetical protein